MEQWNLTEMSYKKILQHLVDVEESRTQWLCDHFKQLSQERDQVAGLLDRYIERLGSFIKGVKRSGPPGHRLPFVIMGSEVEVINLAGQRRQVFRILPINEERVESKDISILSPVGKALLLQAEGASVTIHAPRGDIMYRIESINYFDQ